MKKIISFVLVIILAIVLCNCERSENKEWMPKILSEDSNVFLPNFSYAGYHWGEKEIPNLKPTLNVNDYGAVADDGKDDTEALLKAFSDAHKIEEPVVIKFPAGKFILKDILYIQRSNLVVQGSGRGEDGTIIYMPQPLSELGRIPEELTELEEYLRVNNKRQREPKRGIDEPFSLYAWSGGYIWVGPKGERAKTYMQKYNEPEIELAKITNGKRGEYSFTVENSSMLSEGMLVRINWYNKDGEESSLIDHMYDGKDVPIGSRHWESPDMPLIKQEVTVTNVDENTITIKEPLMHDMKPEWYNRLTEWNHLEEVGIENIRFEFSMDEYFAHHLEEGYNAIYFTNAAHSWARNISFKNGDSGIISDVCSNITVEDVNVEGRKYHYAVQFGDVYSMFAKGINVNAEIWHSLSFNTGARSSVFTDCNVTIYPSLDQHSGANHQNLFDNIKLVEETPDRSFFYVGGDGYWAPTHGAFSTFWNIEIDYKFPNPNNDTLKVKGVHNGPSARLVGIHANYPINITYGPDAYIEGTNEKNIAVPSLYEYQLKQRLNNK
jgi:pectate lyase-like protein